MAPRAAAANGRYPLANQLVAQPGDPSHLAARTTFGLLRSADAGATWTWVCEEALGMLDIAEDPSLALTGGGSAVIAFSQGINVSRDGCAWAPVGGIPAARFAVDVTVSPARPHDVLAIELSIDSAGAPDGGSGGTASVYTLHLVGSADDGATWTEIGQPIPGFLGATVEVAPSTADRIYISGKLLASQQPTLARSDDGGLTFTSVAIAGVGADAGAFIGAVDPVDPDVVYLRISPTASAPGRVLVSHDGGTTFETLLTVPGDVSGFALSADGATLAAGGTGSGLFVGPSATGPFPLTGTIKPSCLTWVGARLLACAQESVDAFAIAASDDEGAHFAPLLHLAEVTPAACPAASSAGICVAKWPAIAAAIGADAGTPGVDAGKPPAAPPTGCSCALTPTTGADAYPFTLLAALVLVAARRRRLHSLSLSLSLPIPSPRPRGEG